MQDTNISLSKKQQRCDKLLNQIQYLENQYQHLQQHYPYFFNTETGEYEEIQTIRMKLQKISSLNKKLEKDEEKLKLQYIMLLKEKFTYASKLKAIQNLGDNFDWNDQSEVLQKIKPLIENTKRRLKQSRGNGPQKN